MRRPKLAPIRWGTQEQALLDAVQARAAVEGVPASNLSETVRLAMAVAVEASAAAWKKGGRK